MKRTKEQTKGMAILLCVIFSLSISASAQQEVSSEIQKENDKFRSAFLSSNMDAISDKYTDEAILMPPNSEPVLGPEAIRAVWNATQGMGVSDLVFKTDIAEMYGNVAIEQGKYKLFAGENVIIDQGKYIVIWEKHNGKWLIKKDIWNTSNPPAPKGNDK